MNPFTGGCHYANGCNKFAAACGACPALGSNETRDLSARIFRRKHAAYDRLNPEKVRVVAPSRWLAKQASQSALFNRFDVCCIPYGLDTEVFKPRTKTIAREVFGVPPKIPIVMFVAQSLDNHRKGMDLLSLH
jgi:hypothetical protein